MCGLQKKAVPTPTSSISSMASEDWIASPLTANSGHSPCVLANRFYNLYSRVGRPGLVNFREGLNRSLSNLKVNVDRYSDDLEIISEKLELLEKTKRYSLLLSELFHCNDRGNFKSFLVETHFAHAFESANIPLIYEVTQSNDHHSTVDFLLENPDGRKIYFELRLIQQREQVRNDIDNQLNLTQTYSVSFNGTDERTDIERLQSNLLAKTQDKNGQPIKFFRTVFPFPRFMSFHQVVLFL